MTDAIDRLIMIQRNQYRLLLIGAAKAGQIGKWEAWRELFNAGFRGRELNGWLLGR